MGSSLSRMNNKLTFDFDDYIRERDELSSLLRNIAESSEAQRKHKTKMQVVSGATAVTAGIAGVTALILAPATFGLSVPVAASTTAAIVGNSITAASITGSAASYGHGVFVSKDIIRQLENLQSVIESISRKDKEVSDLMRSLENDKIHPVMEAKDKLYRKVSLSDDDKAKTTGLAAWSILSPATYALAQARNSAQFKTEQDFEEALINAADTIDEKTSVLRNLERKFRHVDCIPNERRLSRGRLTYIDGGGGCSRVMKVHYHDPQSNSSHEMESDSTNVIRLPEGATNIKILFYVKGGGTVKKIDRSNPKQPWVKADTGESEVDIFRIDQGDGVDAVFFVKGSFTHSHVHKALDFGRHPNTKARKWEWWPIDKFVVERKQLLPDSDTRVLERNVYEPTGRGLSCGACFCWQPIVEPVA